MPVLRDGPLRSTFHYPGQVNASDPLKTPLDQIVPLWRFLERCARPFEETGGKSRFFAERAHVGGPSTIGVPNTIGTGTDCGAHIARTAAVRRNAHVPSRP
jgi:hypothetical protein